jgi:predicted tellurium resistance membrane protein TerC
MIAATAYILIGIGTAVVMRDMAILSRAAVVLVWPLYWFAFAFAHFVGIMPAKCAWCGQSVAGHSKKMLWTAHYLNECQDHPLAKKCAALEAEISKYNGGAE